MFNTQKAQQVCHKVVDNVRLVTLARRVLPLLLLIVFSHVTSTSDVTNRPPRAIKRLNDVILAAPRSTDHGSRGTQKAMTSAVLADKKKPSVPSILLDPLNEILEDGDEEAGEEEETEVGVPVKPDLLRSVKHVNKLVDVSRPTVKDLYSVVHSNPRARTHMPPMVDRVAAA